MFRRIISTPDDFVPTIARVALGVVILPHGLQKTLGLFGGPGFAGAMQSFQAMQIPYVLGLLAIATETVGAILAIVGLLGRFAAFAIVCEMLVAVALVHGRVGFFMNWSGSQQGEGFEYHLLLLALAFIVMLRGSGAYSVDRALMRDGVRG
jgi:putative oxidoreductase